jgi:hypothetical protein
MPTGGQTIPFPTLALAPGEAQASGHAVLARLQDGVEELGALILADLQASIPFFDGLAGDATNDVVRLGVRRIANAFVEIAEGSRPLAPEELAHVETLGTVLAAHGLSEGEILRSVGIGALRTWSYLIDAAEAMPLHRANIRGTTLVVLDSCLFLQQVSAALARGVAAHHRQHTDELLYARLELVQEMLAGTYDSDDDLLARALVLGHDLSLPYGLLLVVSAGKADGYEVLRRTARAIAADLPGAIDGLPRADPSPHVVVLVPVAGDPWSRAISIADRVGAHHGLVVIAVDPVVGPKAVHEAYVDAIRLLHPGTRSLPPGVVRPRELAHHALLASIPEERRRHFVRHTLGHLLDLRPSEKGKLLAALDVLLAYNYVQPAAGSLDLSEKTVSRHLKQVHELTGLDPMDRRNRMRLHLAREIMRSLADEAEEEPG